MLKIYKTVSLYAPGAQSCPQNGHTLSPRSCYNYSMVSGDPLTFRLKILARSLFVVFSGAVVLLLWLYGAFFATAQVASYCANDPQNIVCQSITVCPDNNCATTHPEYNGAYCALFGNDSITDASGATIDDCSWSWTFTYQYVNAPPEVQLQRLDLLLQDANANGGSALSALDSEQIQRRKRLLDIMIGDVVNNPDRSFVAALEGDARRLYDQMTMAYQTYAQAASGSFPSASSGSNTPGSPAGSGADGGAASPSEQATAGASGGSPSTTSSPETSWGDLNQEFLNIKKEVTRLVGPPPEGGTTCDPATGGEFGCGSEGGNTFDSLLEEYQIFAQQAYQCDAETHGFVYKYDDAISLRNQLQDISDILAQDEARVAAMRESCSAQQEECRTQAFNVYTESGILLTHIRNKQAAVNQTIDDINTALSQRQRLMGNNENPNACSPNSLQVFLQERDARLSRLQEDIQSAGLAGLSLPAFVRCGADGQTYQIDTATIQGYQQLANRFIGEANSVIRDLSSVCHPDDPDFASCESLRVELASRAGTQMTAAQAREYLANLAQEISQQMKVLEDISQEALDRRSRGEACEPPPGSASAGTSNQPTGPPQTQAQQAQQVVPRS
ncbi:MAG: hypothetical protein KatS3mg099_076 [Candidatus Parcubacteria bacterium]|nr:MAG: hypothetical protein KatS3mg099_076 [Candidatus Parcubacteria bacterium]